MQIKLFYNKNVFLKFVSMIPDIENFTFKIGKSRVVEELFIQRSVFSHDNYRNLFTDSGF